MNLVKLSRTKFALLTGLLVVAGCGQQGDPVASEPIPVSSVAATPTNKIVANSPSEAYRRMQEYEKKQEYGRLFDSYSKKLQGNMNAQMASAAAPQLTTNKTEQKRYAKMRGKDLFLLVKKINPITVHPYQILSEKVTGDTAILTVEERDRKARKTISMVKEKGVWKMDGEAMQ